MNLTKICTKCNLIKITIDFNKNQYVCKSCRHLYYEKNKEQIKQKIKNNYKKNKNTIKEYQIKNREKILFKKKEYRLKNKNKIKEARRKFYLKNRDILIKNSMKYALKNKRKLKEKRKVYLIKNKEIIAQKKKLYILLNKEKIKINKTKYNYKNKEKIKNYMKEYRLKNKVILSNKNKEYEKKNKEKRDIIRKEYYQNNKQKILNRQYAVISRKIKNDPIFKLRSDISKLMCHYLKKCNKNKDNKSILNILPYSIEDLKIHLEKQFEPWMNWNNRGVYRMLEWDDNNTATWKWQIDHIIPHSKFNYKSINDENFKKCWSLNNLRPLSAKENLIKGNR